MLRSLAAAVICYLVLLCAATSPAWAEGATDEEAERPEWSVKAKYTDVCCCKPSCPCLFGSAPTLGYCEGATLVELEEAHYRETRLDGISVLAVYRGKTWIKFYVSENADPSQVEAAAKLLPTFEGFFAIDNVLEVKQVPVSVERSGERIKITAPNTTAEIEVMKGKNGKPIKIDNLPWPTFPAPPLLDHTQYRSIVLSHRGGDEQFEHSGTNGFTANVVASATASHE